MSKLIVKALQITLASRNIKPAEVIAQIEGELRKARASLLTVEVRLTPFNKDAADRESWFRDKVTGVIKLLDDLIPAEPEGSRPIKGTRAWDKLMAHVGKTSGTSDKTQQTRRELRESLQSIVLAELMAEAVKWEKAPEVAKIKEALEFAILVGDR